MAEFLVRNGGPEAVLVTAKAAKGTASVSFKVRPHGVGRRVTIPDAHVGAIKPEHARFLVRLNAPRVAAPAPSTPPNAPDEQPTMPATPIALAQDLPEKSKRVGKREQEAGEE